MLNGIDFLQVEEIIEFFDKDSPYLDLVKFETDLAQICELVILFSESPGSFVELGSFAAVEEIAEKLLVAIQAKYLSRSSYISKGPVSSLRREYPNSVFTFSDTTIGMTDGLTGSINCPSLVGIMNNPTKVRLGEVGSRTTFDNRKFNHLCKLYVGFLREGYSLKNDEICLLFSVFGVNVDELLLERISFCCAALRWSAVTQSGFDRVHFAYPNENEAVKFTFTGSLRDKTRRRAEFRKYWEDNDVDRVSAVDEALR